MPADPKRAGPPLPFPPGHFHSPVVDPAEVAARRDAVWPEHPELLGIDFNRAHHEHLITSVLPDGVLGFDYAHAPPADPAEPRFHLDNDQFSGIDARVAFALLRHWQPRRVIEVGAGHSSLLIADVAHRYFAPGFQLTCIEAHPRPFLARIAGANVIAAPVQDVPLALFQGLDAGDVLFIDSSHVAKTGSDVNRLYFDVLPRLPRGVRVHVHDVFLPHDYPRTWVLEENRSWNEQYLLRALLTDSARLRVLFGCAYAATAFPAQLARALGVPHVDAYSGGSLWFEVAG
jgi:hypothetical protein